jgi:transcriptional regulator with XRE-family HTH domain
MPSGPTFGSLLRLHRTSADLTQHQLAAKAGISQATLSCYESGSREPTLRIAARLAHALGVELDDLAAPFAPRPKGRRRPQPQLQVAS